jgi:hypothetical protein
MQIVILQAGPYNDARHHAHRLAAGDVFETGHDYALSLIASGLARPANVLAETVASNPPIEPPTEPDQPIEPPTVSAETPPVDADPIVITPADGIDADEASAAGHVLAARKKAKK